MSKHWLVTGGSGFVGRAFILSRLSQGDRVSSLSRRDPEKLRVHQPNVTWVNEWDQLDSDITHVLNLAGEGIADQRWSDARKQSLIDSRIGLTQDLVKWMTDKPIQHFVSASAVGFYGATDQVVDEQAPVGSGFAAELCQQWEAAARQASAPTSIVRLGVVMGPGGFMDRMKPLFKVGLGGPLGDGKQALSWVHRDDVVGLFNHLVEHAQTGTFNATAPGLVSQAEFAKAMGRVMRRPAIMPTPGFAMRLAFGQMADELLLSGQWVEPAQTLASGYQFQHPQIEGAIKSALAQYH